MKVEFEVRDGFGVKNDSGKWSPEQVYAAAKGVMQAQISSFATKLLKEKDETIFDAKIDGEPFSIYGE